MQRHVRFIIGVESLPINTEDLSDLFIDDYGIPRGSCNFKRAVAKNCDVDWLKQIWQNCINKQLAITGW